MRRLSTFVGKPVWRLIATIVFIWSCTFHGALIGQDELDEPSETTKTYWIFLTTGERPSGVERSEIERMQAEHIGNFGRLFELGRLSAAGPAGDPDGKIRGIVCVNARDESAMKEDFAPDPFIEHGYLKLEAHPVVDQLGAFNRDFSKTEMEEYQMVVVQLADDRGGEMTLENAQSNHEYLKSICKPDKLRVALRFESNDSQIVGVLLMKKQDNDEAEGLIKNIPSIANGDWKFAIMSLHMSKGILDD